MADDFDCLLVETETVDEIGYQSPIWVSVVGAPKILEVWILFILGGIRNLQINLAVKQSCNSDGRNLLYFGVCGFGLKQE